MSSESEANSVTRTPFGCACIEGVGDRERFLCVGDPPDGRSTLAAERGTVDQADPSRKILGTPVRHRS
jgi:hypothetical protein